MITAALLPRQARKEGGGAKAVVLQVRVWGARAHAPGARRAPAVRVGAPVRDGAGRPRRADAPQEGHLRGAAGTACAVTVHILLTTKRRYCLFAYYCVFITFFK